ncbi:MAG: hypothetical protein R3C01_13615 [Planctomycetaceae bacterium]
MMEGHRFQHQSYPTQPLILPQYHLLKTTDAVGVDFSTLHAELGVRDVFLVHGTFMGDDPFAITETLRSLAGGSALLERPLLSLAAKLQEQMKPTAEQFTSDVGNYTPEYREEFERLVGGDPLVRLLEPTWSGQNHHFARADLAVRLLCALDGARPAADERVLLWGHSHAGNGFAILSHLLANDPPSMRAFFDAVGPQEGAHWQRAKEILANALSPHPWARSVLIAAFGTPVRYGWNRQGYRHLVHVLNHVPVDPNQPSLARPMFPPHSLGDMVNAKYGDWVQAFGIAGTDVVPPTSKRVNQQLAPILEAGLADPVFGNDTRFIRPERVKTACARWKTGTRCHADGTNLLVTYEPSGRTTSLGRPIESALFGHGVATTTTWLPSHLALILKTLQQAERPNP